MRTATNYQEKNNATCGWGANVKNCTDMVNKIAITNYGTVTAQSFINILVENGRLPYEYRRKRTQVFADSFLTDLLNNNEDLFPIQF